MTNILIAAIVVFLLAFFVLAYLWLVRPRPSANYRAYQEIGRIAARNKRGKSGSTSGPEWRESREWR